MLMLGEHPTSGSALKRHTCLSVKKKKGLRSFCVVAKCPKVLLRSAETADGAVCCHCAIREGRPIVKVQGICTRRTCRNIRIDKRSLRPETQRELRYLKVLTLALPSIVPQPHNMHALFAKSAVGKGRQIVVLEGTSTCENLA